MSFEDAWKENRHIWESTKNLARAMYLAGAASRQGEVELLEKEIIETQEFLNNQNCIKQAEVNELQKRINEALDHTVNHGGYDDLTHIIEILKGQNNG